MNLDDQLKSALQRQDPGEDFTERVLARARAGDRAERPASRNWFAWLLPRRPLAWAVPGALVVVMLVSIGGEYRRRREGEQARERVMLALEIAESRLIYAQQKALAVGSPAAAVMEKP